MIFGTNTNGEIVFGVQQCGIVSIDVDDEKKNKPTTETKSNFR